MSISSRERSLFILAVGILALSLASLFNKETPPPSQDFQSDLVSSLQAPLPPLLSARPIAPTDRSSREPPFWIFLNEKGLFHFNEGRYQEALLFFGQALEQNKEEAVLQKNVAQAHAQLGWEAIRLKRFGEAGPHFESALRFFKGESSYHLGNAVALYRMQQENAAAASLQTALALNPKEATAYKILGEIAYGQNAFEKAQSAWEKAIELDPGDRALSVRLEKLKGESKIFSNFQSEGTGRFTLLFDGRGGEDHRRVLHLLEEAYRDIGQALSYYPEKTIFAVLYADQQFRDVTQSPAWTKGLFDGRIHLPIGGTVQNEALLKKLIYHEYTHALVHQLSQGKTPTWLNEGLALFFEEKDQKGRHRLPLPLIPLEALHGSFMDYDESTAHRAYEESRSATGYLIDRYGLFRMKLLLEKLASTASFPLVFEEVFMIRYADFQAEWQKKIAQES